uniref:Uncharacterized protein n=1 Tax=Cacopsylla melanoneura TaxID=428564 RepID=A0A8D8UKF5_9HEMI
MRYCALILPIFMASCAIVCLYCPFPWLHARLCAYCSFESICNLGKVVLFGGKVASPFEIYAGSPWYIVYSLVKEYHFNITVLFVKLFTSEFCTCVLSSCVFKYILVKS